MTPEAAGDFRGFLNLLDFNMSDDPEAVFKAMAVLSVWSSKQKKEPSAEHDRMLEPLAEHTAIWMGLLLHLATVDYHYFHLAKRMAARTLMRHEQIALVYRRMSALLLVNDPPSGKKWKLASHTAIIIGISVVQQLGWRPTESDHKTGLMDRSGCGKMAIELGRLGQKTEYYAIESVWKERVPTLNAAGFGDEQVSAFFGLVSPMK